MASGAIFDSIRGEQNLGRSSTLELTDRVFKGLSYLSSGATQVDNTELARVPEHTPSAVLVDHHHTALDARKRRSDEAEMVANFWAARCTCRLTLEVSGILSTKITL